MRKWNDEIDYRAGEVKSSVLHLPSLRISVHRHIHYPGKWLLSVRELSIETRILRSHDLEQARAEALEYVTKFVDSMVKDLENQWLKPLEIVT